ncbi:MAG: DUF5714 domain-containing protein [Hyphomicrobiales bacterium]
MDNFSGCIVCGRELIYKDEESEIKCEVCHNVFMSNVACPNGHYICDSCHSMSAIEFIARYCENSKEKNPIVLATTLMHHPSVKMHGPEHHFLVPAALLTTYANSMGEREKLGDWLRKAKSRSKIVPGGVCGSHGSCGAGVGAGIFISIITEATPLKVREWQCANMATGKALIAIAYNGGPRCCKRNTALSIIQAAKYIEEVRDFKWKFERDVKCTFSQNNKQCTKHDCLFYDK